ncbi:aminotransferase class I/II-fold pyridoxal phosphate-dependent enzyme [Daejeonella oryzae]|uniref:aminotransferase class I/II-fold pyridoxal phosphate-dependent enzyme n=1 Tax=Daejeonella oryzae TaxID=1122943 RepID=UPI00040DD6AF|nr:8-amino-7-oxononanoate synthase [Daejeonella oryzae]
MSLPINTYLQDDLNKRKDQALYRQLQINKDLIDFCSNDYLSFARCPKIKQKVKDSFNVAGRFSGSTGSRSISGNTAQAEDLEKRLARFHRAEAALLFNSGYDANLGLFSCIAKKDDFLVCDELIHASIIDGGRLSYASRLRFAHNDAYDLEKKLQHASGKIQNGQIFVAVESVYSMDGDIAPLKLISDLCKEYKANLIVDEAHATGVFGRQGRGLVSELGLEAEVFARIHTFGKAIGCHGAVVVGTEVLRNYLINFSRSFIFTTALSSHSLTAIESAYDQLLSEKFDNSYLHELICHFKSDFFIHPDFYLIESTSPVQSLIIPGNERARSISLALQAWGFDVRAILSPSVPVGKERLRISLHMHNSLKEVDNLKNTLNEILA